MHDCFILCARLCTACESGAHEGQKKGFVSPGAGVTDGRESPCVRQELNPGSLEEQQVFLTPELSLQP